ncbi:MAG: hypothetical protein ACJ0K4_08065 [Verrucomicrobiales bacterium]
MGKQNNEIDNLRPPFMCEFSSRVRIVVDQVTGQKRGRNNQCGGSYKERVQSVCFPLLMRMIPLTMKQVAMALRVALTTGRS